MVHGLSIDMTGEDLAKSINERVAVHRAKLGALQAELRALSKRKARRVEEDDPIRTALSGGSQKERLERRIQEHGERVVTLTFLRDHLTPSEIYRLGQSDLKLVDLVPARDVFLRC
jgi:hypothetical protein